MSFKPKLNNDRNSSALKKQNLEGAQVVQKHEANLYEGINFGDLKTNQFIGANLPSQTKPTNHQYNSTHNQNNFTWNNPNAFRLNKNIARFNHNSNNNLQSSSDQIQPQIQQQNPLPANSIVNNHSQPSNNDVIHHQQEQAMLAMNNLNMVNKAQNALVATQGMNANLPMRTPSQNNNLYQPIPYSGYGTKIKAKEFNKLVPKPIIKEIRIEKIKNLFTAFLMFVATFITVGLATLFYVAQFNNINTIIGISVGAIPNPILMIVLSIITVGIAFISIFAYKQIHDEANSYYHQLKQNDHRVPNFIIANYKKMIKNKIIINWLAYPSYVILLIVLGILVGLQQYVGRSFSIGFWSLGTIKNLKPEIFTVTIIIVSLLALHVLNLVLIKKRKANIVGYYGYDIVMQEDVKAISKKVNRICLIVFICSLLLLVLLIFIPIALAKRKKEGKFIWPWNSIK